MTQARKKSDQLFMAGVSHDSHNKTKQNNVPSTVHSSLSHLYSFPSSDRSRFSPIVYFYRVTLKQATHRKMKSLQSSALSLSLSLFQILILGFCLSRKGRPKLKGFLFVQIDSKRVFRGESESERVEGELSRMTYQDLSGSNDQPAKS